MIILLLSYYYPIIILYYPLLSYYYPIIIHYHPLLSIIILLLSITIHYNPIIILVSPFYAPATTPTFRDDDRAGTMQPAAFNGPFVLARLWRRAGPGAKQSLLPVKFKTVRFFQKRT